MRRESVEEKALRYLGERRLTVVRVGPERGLAQADVVGSEGASYSVFVSPAGWACSCPAYRRCAHLAALELVAPKLGGEPGPDCAEPGRDFRQSRAGLEAAPVDEPDPRRGCSRVGAREPWPTLESWPCPSCDGDGCRVCERTGRVHYDPADFSEIPF